MTNLPQASQIEMWLTDKLVFYVRNPRKNDAAVDRMCGSIKEFGFKVPVLARSDGTVVDGHLRIKAARKLGITEIPVILCDEWTESQVKAFRILVNRSATWAEFDEELLSLELQELAAAEFDLGLSGFDDQEVARLLEAGDATQGLNDEDSVPDAPEAPITRPGELWNLGNHKLLIGDATKRADVGRLMGNDTADLVFTDLPYNCAYEGYTDEHLTIQNDRMSDADYEQFLANAFQF